MVRRFGQPVAFSRRHLAAPLLLSIWLILAFAPCAGAAPLSDGCILDNCADKAPPAANPDSGDAGAKPPPFRPHGAPIGRGPSGDFDFYVLALSWSPGFCRTPAGARAQSQCESGANLGFVVHGLWPQYEHGYPSDCPFGAQSPSRIALQSVAGLYPTEGLARHEWRTHGVCSGKSPTDYFDDVRRARAAIVIPPPFQNASSDQNWTSIDIERAFVAANRRLQPGMLGVACARGALQEVRICFSKDLRDFHACPEISRRGCSFGPVSVPPPL